MRRLRRQLLWLTVIVALLIWLNRHVPQFERFLMAPIRLAQGIAVSVELSQIHAALVRHRQVEGQLPAPQEFHAFVRRNFNSAGRDTARDMWGYPYGYGVARDRSSAFFVWSSGPDGRRDTDDDIRLDWRIQR